MSDSAELENFKILRSIWKNTFDKILEIKVLNKRSLAENKNKIFEEDKKKIDEKYEKDYNAKFIDNKINISEAKNSSNIEKIQRRNQLFENLRVETLEKLKVFANPNNVEYKDLIKNIILQGSVKLLEDLVVLRIRSEDETFIRKFLPDIEKEYTLYMRQHTGDEYTVRFEIDGKFLENEHGGVILMNSNRKIQCINDLQSRLNLTFEQSCPTIKKMLFN